jgi:integrase
VRVFKQCYTDRKGQKKQSKKWYLEFKDPSETVRRLPAFTDKGASDELGRRIEKLVAGRVMGDSPIGDLARWLETLPSTLKAKLAGYGILDARTVANSKPLLDHLDDFHASLLHKGDSIDHANIVRTRARRICEGCRFRQFTDIKPSKVQRYLSERRDNGDGISNQTSNFYLQAIKQFCRWMVRDGRVSESPVDHLTGLNVKLDRRHDRRNLSAKELSAILEVTMNGPIRHKLDGRSRAMLYRAAMETGLRRKELKSLRPCDIDFESTPPSIVVHPTNTKNRRPTVQTIRRELADELVAWIQEAEIGPETPLWVNLTQNTAMMLRKDLKVAGIPYVDEAGLYADFHALRHSYISLITQGGVHPKLAQRLARHSDINLTMNRYSHTVMADEAEALEVLPEFPSMIRKDDDESHTLRATGTDDTRISPSNEGRPSQSSARANEREKNVLPLCLPERAAKGGISVHRDAVSADQKGPRERTSGSNKKRPETLSDKGSEAFCESGEGGIRTPGTCYSTLVFETSTIGHSVTSPCGVAGAEL